MGKKNKGKKSRHYDDDDLLGPPSPAIDQEDEMQGGDIHDGIVSDTENASSPKTGKKKKEKGGGAGTTQKKAINIDLVQLEENMTDILRNHDGQSDDWLYRTIEKNMHLPKHSLKQNLEPHVFDEMLERVRQTLEEEFEEEEDKRKLWDCLVAEMCSRSELTAKDEAKLRIDAEGVGIDPEEAVDMVLGSIRDRVKKQQNDTDGSTEDEGGTKEESKEGDLASLDAKNASLPVSILLALQPYTQQSSTNDCGTIVKPFFTLRQYACILLNAVLSLLFGEQAKDHANLIYEKLHLPALKAAQFAKEKEEDAQMLQENTHLWSNQQSCWVKKDSTHSHSSSESTTPPTIRWNAARKQWERWSKNLKTRTKAMKQAEAAGISTAFTKGTFVTVRAGEGWATAPEQPEVEKEQIAIGGIRFFACIPETTSGELEVADVTSWATKTLLTKEAARELEAVDSGRELFSFDVSSLLLEKKDAGKKKAKGKNTKRKKQGEEETLGEEEKEEHSVVRKGIGCTAKVSEKYLDRLRLGKDGERL
mmetsp:Transcript_24752/g.52509  ORF Transcript_24752/g.52509 Transcript_24752/m.52509 type:complete len:534 (+) Transcript_24752:128-1729(+)|eukprot:CAMPEP_0183748738 /NCGR_PEP_ID=MMETSP0737-20130205/67927_1 /TAXON_ID=385413 /ORGANISM="Thalassiosira miniscula, Strain CCMP1093" /LENGTH=533 /DNA_ID=CAMNT_0025984477 /DNA_START=20 /DNA_END=1621 /DNA_ORIENTATION=-